jgi:hypothetical protein
VNYHDDGKLRIRFDGGTRLRRLKSNCDSFSTRHLEHESFSAVKRCSKTKEYKVCYRTSKDAMMELTRIECLDAQGGVVSSFPVSYQCFKGHWHIGKLDHRKHDCATLLQTVVRRYFAHQLRLDLQSAAPYEYIIHRWATFRHRRHSTLRISLGTDFASLGLGHTRCPTSQRASHKEKADAEAQRLLLDEKEGKKFEVYRCHICSHWEVRAAGKKCGRNWGFKEAAPDSDSGGKLWERGPPSPSPSPGTASRRSPGREPPALLLTATQGASCGKEGRHRRRHRRELRA